MNNAFTELRAVIFDLDGTLIKFKLDINGMKREIIYKLLELGIPKNMLSLDTKIADMIKKSEEYFLKNNRKDLALKVTPLVFSIADKFEVKAAKTSELMDDTKIVLKNIKDIGLKLGLLTNNGKKATNIVLEKHNIAKFFDAIITRDDSQTLKPDPTGLRLILSALNITPKETIFVGDSTIDARAAREMGVNFLGIETGLYSRRELQKENAIIVFDDLKSLLKFIVRRIKK